MKRKIIPLMALFLSLSACESIDALKADFLSGSFGAEKIAQGGAAEALISDGCPQIKIMDELGEFYDFGNAKTTRHEDLISQARIFKTTSACTYTAQSVTVDVDLTFKGALGARARASASETPFVNYPFFVAVSDPLGRILGKEIFGAPMNYNAGQDAQTHKEHLRHIIPISSKTKGHFYTIKIGFQLTPEQLAYNRYILGERAKIATKETKNPIAKLMASDPVTNSAPVPLQGNN